MQTTPYLASVVEHANQYLSRTRDRADVHLIESVGKNLPEVIRTGSGILEFMAEDGLFDFYDSGLGLNIANRHLARMVAQVAHRYPRMKILEIGMFTCLFLLKLDRTTNLETKVLELVDLRGVSCPFSVPHFRATPIPIFLADSSRLLKIVSRTLKAA